MLNARQQAFVNEYARGGFKNASEAAIKAGYSERTAAQGASQLLKNIKVAEAIEDLRKPAKEEAIVDATFVLKELRDIVVTCGQKVALLDPMTGDPMTDEQGMTMYKKLDPAGANAALKTLSQCLGMGKEQVDKDQTIQTLSETLQDLLRK